MSLKSILHAIVSFVSHIWSLISSEEKKLVHAGVSITEAIKNFDDKNPAVADFLTAVIPGDLDDHIKEKAREVLPQVLAEEKLIDSSTTDAEIGITTITAIKDLTGFDLAEKLDNVAKRLVDKLSGGKISWDQLAYIVKFYYDHEFKTPTDEAVKEVEIAD